MISSQEIRTRARKLQVEERYVVRDYVLSHVLMAISGEFQDLLLFRGGTALCRMYWPDFRLSQDLDFITLEMPADYEERLGRSVSKASDAMKMPLVLSRGPRGGGRYRHNARHDSGDLLIDTMAGERAQLPILALVPRFEYSDLPGNSKIHTLDLREILGNKWYMLDNNDRLEPRDLFDIWAGITQFGVSFEDIAIGHNAKYGYLPQRHSLDSAKRLEGRWETRLSYQLGNLLEFDEALADVRNAFETWESASES